MCLAIPGKVIFIENDHATIDVMGVQRRVATGLLEDVKIGDYLLAHAGCGIAIIDEDEAHSTLQILRELGEAYEE